MQLHLSVETMLFFSKNSWFESELWSWSQKNLNVGAGAWIWVHIQQT